MRQLVLICLVIFLVAPAVALTKAQKAARSEYRTMVREESYCKAVDQKYAYNHARREAHNQGKLRVLRAKYSQKVRGRNRYNYYGPRVVR